MHENIRMKCRHYLDLPRSRGVGVFKDKEPVSMSSMRTDCGKRWPLRGVYCRGDACLYCRGDACVYCRGDACVYCRGDASRVNARGDGSLQ